MATATSPVMPPAAPAPSTTAPADPIDSPSLTLDDLHRLSVDEYEQMGCAGLLEDARVELIDGLLICKMPKNPQHAKSVRAIHRRLTDVVPEGWSVFKEDPIRIPDLSEPEPDIAIVRADPGDYQTHHPGPGDIVLVVEVADSSLVRDRTAKMAIYAKSGIPVYWLVNLIDGQLEVYSNPDTTQRTYRSQVKLGRDDQVMLIIDDRETAAIPVSDLLP
jgi:Uma2 family endonuclease